MDVTNAGQDDGLPTSVLREISQLKSLSHDNLTRIVHAEVNHNLAQIVYEFHEHNLKDYIKKNSKVTPLKPLSKYNDKFGYTLNLQTIKSFLY